MYAGISCFWVEPTGTADRALRRHAPTGGDPEHAYHSASVDIGVFPLIRLKPNEDGVRMIGEVPVEDYAGDDRWPTRCECGYEFQPDDGWQVIQKELYQAEDGRQTHVTHAHRCEPLPGAMFDTWWRPDLRKEDGLAISVICPNGAEWCIDDKALGGGEWTREGTPPMITVSPSIVANDYHGHLVNGAFTDG